MSSMSRNGQPAEKSLQLSSSLDAIVKLSIVREFLQLSNEVAVWSDERSYNPSLCKSFIHRQAGNPPKPLHRHRT
jgi:hypothetical protein